MYDIDTTKFPHDMHAIVAAGEHPIGTGICRDIPLRAGQVPVVYGDDWRRGYVAMGLAMTEGQRREWVSRYKVS
jgi:hypothetical protein